jgi:hypothetical protein
MNVMEILQREEVIVQAVEFGPDSMTVYFQEKREIGESAIVSRVMEVLINSENRGTVYLDMQEMLRRLVDDTYVDIRNPDNEI